LRVGGRRQCRAAAVAVMVAVSTLVGASGGSAVAAYAAGERTPPCTKPAFTSGLHRGANRFPHGEVVRPWGCAGRFAYAAVIVTGNELTILFRAHGAAWETASRARYCTDGSVPLRIWQNACNTN